MAYRPAEPGLPGGPQEDLPHRPDECLSARHTAQAAPAHKSRDLLGSNRVGAGAARHAAQGHAPGSVRWPIFITGDTRWSIRPMRLRPRYPITTRLRPATQIWRDLEGYYTRYGDVRELLAGIDDRYVIMNAGDEITSAFSRAASAARRMGARLCDRRRWLDQGWRLQLGLLRNRPALALPRKEPDTTQPQARWKMSGSIAIIPRTGRTTKPAT